MFKWFNVTVLMIKNENYCVYFFNSKCLDKPFKTWKGDFGFM